MTNAGIPQQQIITPITIRALERPENAGKKPIDG
jgi:hypothetical protein